MSSRMPPVPPSGRSPKGPGSQTPGVADEAQATRNPPANLKEQDRQGNINQNTTHQGHQQDR